MIVNSMRLQDACLCVNCDLIVDSATYCPACGDGISLHPLARFINRPAHTCVDQPNQLCAVAECAHSKILEASKALIQSATRADSSASDTLH